MITNIRNVILIIFLSTQTTIYGKKVSANVTDYPRNPYDKDSSELEIDSSNLLRRPRIAVGHASLLGDIPYHLQIRYDNIYLCGASLVISPHGQQVVITSGECVTQSSNNGLYPLDKLSVWGGRLIRDGYHIFEQVHTISKIVRHPDWRRRGIMIQHDIAVIHIRNQFEINRIVQPINLPSTQDKPVVAGEYHVISGWGYYYHTQVGYADRLQVSRIVVEKFSDCKNAYSAFTAPNSLQGFHYCLGKIGSPDFQGACEGDQGSPAAGVENNQLYLAGVFSFGRPKCGNRYQPSVYITVSWYLRWIKVASAP